MIRDADGNHDLYVGASLRQLNDYIVLEPPTTARVYSADAASTATPTTPVPCVYKLTLHWQQDRYRICAGYIKDFDAELARERSAPLREHGVDIDMASLVYAGERSHVVDYLRSTRWDANGVPCAELFVRNGIAVPSAEDDDPLGEIIFISGTLGA